jgi:hypothetical protein
LGEGPKGKARRLTLKASYNSALRKMLKNPEGVGGWERKDG